MPAEPVAETWERGLLSSVEDRLAPLIEEIRRSRQRAGALSFAGGQAFIFVFFGRTLHATAPGGMTGPDAVRSIGRMVAEGSGYQWTSMASGPTFSLAGTTQELVDLLIEGAHSASVAAVERPDPRPESPAPPAPAVDPVAQTGIPSAGTTNPGAPPVPASTGATPGPTGDASSLVFDYLTPEAAPRPVDPETEHLPVVAAQLPLPVVAPTTSDLGGDDDSDEWDARGGLLWAGEMTESEARHESEMRAGGQPRPRPSITTPPLLAGPTILEETPVSAARLDTFLGDAPRAQLVYRDDARAVSGVALFQGTRLVDALWCAPGEVLMGPPAYELIRGARYGSVRINELPEDVFIALPACWQGSLTLAATPVADVDLEQLDVGLSYQRATAALMLSTATDEGVVLFHAGRVIAAYIASAPRRQMNRDALAVLATDPTALVKVRTLFADHLPQPASLPTKHQDRAGIGAAPSEAWEAFLVAAQLVARARLKTHSHRVEAILSSVAPGREGATDAARQVRSLVQRGVSQMTMARLADQIEELALSRL